MSEDQLTPLGLEIKKAKILKQKQKFAQEKSGYSWNAVAKEEAQKPLSATITSSIIDTFAIKTNSNAIERIMIWHILSLKSWN